MGSDGPAGRDMAPQAAHPSSLAAAALRRQTPEVGAVCGNAARTDLCGGRPVTGVPTAITALCLMRAVQGATVLSVKVEPTAEGSATVVAASRRALSRPRLR